MTLLFLLAAALLLIYGVVSLIHGALLLGLVLIVVAVFLGSLGRGPVGTRRRF